MQLSEALLGFDPETSNVFISSQSKHAPGVISPSAPRIDVTQRFDAITLLRLIWHSQYQNHEKGLPRTSPTSHISELSKKQLAEMGFPNLDGVKVTLSLEYVVPGEGEAAE